MVGFNTLPVSNIVNVQVVLSALLAQAPAINTALFIGTSTVIPVTEREREYSSLTAVALDFTVGSDEYQSAALWFGQAPQPTNLFIGRWVNTASNGQLIGGPVLAANLLISAWNAVTAGAFTIFVDGIPYSLTGMNFSGATNLNGVASIIQTALRAATSGTQTVVYNAVYNDFVITDSSGTTGTASVIGFVQASTAIGSLGISGGVPAPNDTFTLNATVVTFVASGATGNQVNIGVDIPTTLSNLLTFLNSSVDVQIVKNNYSLSGSHIYIVNKTPGTAGNSYTIAKSGTNLTVSGATLAGGAATDISAMTSATSTSSGAFQSPGIAAESALECVTVFDLDFPGTTYGLVIVSPAASDADHEAVAGYIEGVAPKHYYGITTAEGGVIVPGDTSDLAYVLKQLLYNHTAIQYSSTNAYAICSYLSRILTTQWLGSNTTITLMFKQEPGVIAENLNINEADAAKAKNCNVYVVYENGTQFIQYGTSCSGQFTDTVIGADWLAGQIQTNVFNVLFGSPTKIPQTDAGMGQLVAAAIAACQQAVINGYAAPGVWNANGFGPLTQGQTLNAGFLVYAPPMATQTEAVRQTRAGTVMQVAVKNAGAIQSDDIILTINQ